MNLSYYYYFFINLLFWGFFNLKGICMLINGNNRNVGEVIAIKIFSIIYK